MKILYIEDHESLAGTVCAFLKMHGYEVEHHSKGATALARFAEEPKLWDLLIVDLELPDMTGQDVMTQIAAQRSNLPIVVLSGVPGVKSQHELHYAGASILLAKPTEARVLLYTVQNLIGKPPQPAE